MEFIMSKDPTSMLYRHLKRALPTRKNRDGSEFQWVHQGSLPKGWNPNKGLAVVVMDDATTEDETSHDRTLVRVNVHSHDYNAARKMGRNIHQYFLSKMGGFGLGIDRRRTSNVIVGPDSLVGGYVATVSFSVGTSKALFDF